MTRPSPIDVGTEIEMSFSSADTRIVVQDVPLVQPYVDTDGIWLVIDQYGDEHMTQQDGETWVTATSDELSPEGSEIWLAVQEGRYVPPINPAPSV